MLGVVEDVVDGALLDDLSGVHDEDAVGDLRDHSEVVGDQDHRQAPLLVEVLNQLHDLRLDRDVEGGGRLVGDQDPGLEGKGHRDHRALAHPAGELVRIVVDALLGIRDPDRAQELCGAPLRLPFRHVLVGLDLLDDLVTHPVDRVE